MESCGHLQFRRCKLESWETKEASVKGQSINQRRSHKNKIIEICSKVFSGLLIIRAYEETTKSGKEPPERIRSLHTAGNSA